MSDGFYPKAKGAVAGLGANQGPIDWDADVFYVMLVTSTYITGVSDATKKTHQWRSDITGEVAAGGGYTTGGQQLSGITVSQTGDNYMIDSTDPAWAAATITARGAVLFKRVGADLTTPGDDPVIGWYDFTTDKASTGGTFTIQVAAGGWVQYQ